MYTVHLLADGADYTIDNNDPNDTTRKLLSPQLELEENAFGSFSFSVYKNHANYPQFQAGDAEIEVYRTDLEGVEEDVPTFRGRMLEVKTSASTIKSYVFEGELSYLQDSVQIPAKYENITPDEYVTKLLAIHNGKMPVLKQFKKGIVTVTDDNTSDHITGRVNRGSYQTSYNSTTWSCLKALVDELGGFFQIRYEDGVRYLDYLKDHVKRDPCPTINFGENLVEYADEWSLAELYTVLIPLGADYQTTDSAGNNVTATTTIESVNNGSVYLSAGTDIIEKYGRREKCVEFKGILDPTHLKKIAQLYLNNTQFDNMVLNLTAVDLSCLMEDEAEIRFQEVVLAKADIYGLPAGGKEFPVTKVSIPIKNPAGAIYTMSTNTRMIRSMSTKITDYDKDAQDAIGDLADDIAASKTEEITTSQAAQIDKWIFGIPQIMYRLDETLALYLLHPDFMLRAWDAANAAKNLINTKRMSGGYEVDLPSLWPEAINGEFTDGITLTDSANWYYASAGLVGNTSGSSFIFNPYTYGYEWYNADDAPVVVIYAVIWFEAGTDARFGFSSGSSYNDGIFFGIDENGHLGYTRTYDGTGELTVPTFSIPSSASVGYVDATSPIAIMITSGGIHTGSSGYTCPNFLVVDSYNDGKSQRRREISDTSHPFVPYLPRTGTMRINYGKIDSGNPPAESTNKMYVSRIVECGGLVGQIMRDEVFDNIDWLGGRFVTGAIKSDADKLPSEEED